MSVEANSSAIAPWEDTAPLVDAQGWHITGEGAVVLSVENPDGSPTPPQTSPAHCSPPQLSR